MGSLYWISPWLPASFCDFYSLPLSRSLLGLASGPCSDSPPITDPTGPLTLHSPASLPNLHVLSLASERPCDLQQNDAGHIHEESSPEAESSFMAVTGAASDSSVNILATTGTIRLAPPPRPIRARPNELALAKSLQQPTQLPAKFNMNDGCIGNECSWGCDAHQAIMKSRARGDPRAWRSYPNTPQTEEVHLSMLSPSSENEYRMDDKMQQTSLIDAKGWQSLDIDPTKDLCHMSRCSTCGQIVSPDGSSRAASTLTSALTSRSTSLNPINEHPRRDPVALSPTVLISEKHNGLKLSVPALSHGDGEDTLLTDTESQVGTKLSSIFEKFSLPYYFVCN